MRPPRPDAVTVASSLSTPPQSIVSTVPSMSSTSVPSLASNKKLSGGYLDPNRKSYHYVSYSEMAARKRLTRSTLGRDVYPSSTITSGSTIVDYAPSGFERHETRVESERHEPPLPVDPERHPSHADEYASERPELRAGPSSASTRTFNTSESIPLSPRRRLPGVPIPSYDVAVEAPLISPREAKSMMSMGTSYMSEHHEDPDVAPPPRYER